MSTQKKKTVSRTNKKPTKEQLAENKKRTAFKKQISNIFVYAGFEPMKVQGFQFELGNRSNELDYCFIYENIIVICEDTIRFIKAKEKAEEKGEPFNRNHKLEKNETAGVILNNKKDFVDILRKKFSTCDSLSKYRYSEFSIFYLYFDYGIKEINAADIKRYNYLKFVNSSTFKYFSSMAKSIKASFKYELFRFFKLSKDSIGKPNPMGNGMTSINASIIYPDSVTGYNDGIRMVSFMMKPKDLIENSYVLRKDGWETDVDLYQRLITYNRIKSIRNFITKNKTMFLNNIIVTLPDGITFSKIENGARTQINLQDINDYKNKNVEINIPVDYNSMAIIDGQHRVYAYYQDIEENQSEKIVSSLREELNILVTGIIYPKNEKYSDELEKRKFESNLFVSINKNATQVDSDTLIQVQAIMDPTSGEAISRKLLERLNKEDIFENMFQLSKVEDAPIKTATIIQYALSSLLVAKNSNNSLFHYWLIENNLPNDYTLRSSDKIKEYINYCVKHITTYFKAIKSKFNSYWNKESKLLMVISINAFIIAFRETLHSCQGPQDYSFYSNVFKDWDFSFENSKDKDNQFPYAGSQYSKFAKNEIIPLFKKVLNSSMNSDDN